MNPGAASLSSSTPLVSAVLICWNHERFVRAAVESALGQTYTNLQLIVIDNGSADSSPRQLEQLAREHPGRFTLVLRPENAGLIPALNQGLAMAGGPYFTALSTDDMWLPDKVERQVAFLESHPEVHMISGQMRVIDEEGRPSDWQARRHAGEVTFEDLMRDGCMVNGPTLMCRTEALRAVGGYDPNVKIEDYSLALAFTHRGLKVVARDEVDTLYRRHGNNWTARPVWAERLEIGRVYRSHPEYKAFVRRNLAGYFRHLAGHDKRRALKLLREEPLAWTLDDVGVGLLKLLVPRSLLGRYRAAGRGS